MNLDIFDNPAADVELNKHVSLTVSKAIASGRLQPNDKLPTEHELAKYLKIHRLTVNRGYQALKDAGLVVRQRGRGTFVSPTVQGQSSQEEPRRMERVALIVGTAEGLLDKPTAQLFITMKVLDGVTRCLARHGCYPVLVSIEDFGRTNWVPALDGIEGAILVCRHSPMPSVLLELLARNVPAVTTLWRPGTFRVPTVTYQRDTGTYLATRHLIELGHTRIGSLGVDARGEFKPKFTGYAQGLQQAQLDMLAKDILSSDHHWLPGEAYSRMRQRICEGDLPSAFVAGTDSVAIEAIQALTDGGINVPQEISVTGYDNIFESTVCSPALTTVDAHFEEVGRVAVEKLLAWPVSVPAPDHSVVAAELIVRHSTARHAGHLNACGETADRTTT